MIAKLHGIIDTIGEDFCVIDVNGVGYLVSASAKTLSKLKMGNEATLLTIMTVREDDISLFGFADEKIIIRTTATTTIAATIIIAFFRFDDFFLSAS